LIGSLTDDAEAAGGGGGGDGWASEEAKFEVSLIGSLTDDDAKTGFGGVATTGLLCCFLPGDG